MTISLKHVLKTDEHGLLIMKWRNDIVTRNMSFNQKLKVWDTFKPIFYEKYFDNYIKPIFAYLGDTKIGFVGGISNNKADPETGETVCKIGINICPKYRGKGYGKQIIIKTIELITTQYPNMIKIIAQIKSVNTISYRLFLSCGFKYKEKKTICDSECIIAEYKIKAIDT